MALRTLSICSGIGGLDLGWKLASGGRTVCYVEREAYAAATLVARMEDETLDLAPIWSDLRTLDCRRWRGRVDGAIGGIPCQPYSAAGRELGAKDERDLWPALLRILRECELEWLFLENVGRFASNPDGLRRILGDLTEMGWDAQWGVFSCGALGAPHRRERLFILAYSERGKLRIQQGRSGWENGQGPAEPADDRENVGDASLFRGRTYGASGDITLGTDPKRSQSNDRSKSPGQKLSDAYQQQQDEAKQRNGNLTGCPGKELADTSIARPERRRRSPERRIDLAQLGLHRERLADTESLGRDERLLSLGGEATLPDALVSRTFWPPGQDPEKWRHIDRRLQPSAPKHDFRGVADGVPDWILESNRYRIDRLRCLGNAVSPPVAAVAWSVLRERMCMR